MIESLKNRLLSFDEHSPTTIQGLDFGRVLSNVTKWRAPHLGIRNSGLELGTVSYDTEYDNGLRLLMLPVVYSTKYLYWYSVCLVQMYRMHTV